MSGEALFLNEPGIGHEMQSVFAWVAADDGTGEGIIAFDTPRGPIPMVCATPDAALKLTPLAQLAASKVGRTVRLLRFDHRVEVKVLQP